MRLECAEAGGSDERGMRPSLRSSTATLGRSTRGLLPRFAHRRLCTASGDDPSLAARFSELTDLADDRLGSRILFATDEWFATADNMLKPSAPHFDPETFCTQGKVMDGWESRRRRLAGHDWSLVRLGLAGYVHGVELDTAHFTGNQVPAASVFAACIDTADDTSWLGPPRSNLGERGTCSTPEEIAEARAKVEAVAEWTELVPVSPLRAGYTEGGSSIHRFAVPSAATAKRVTHLLVNAHPDGGLSRMRAWGVVGRDFDTELAASAVGAIDLLSALHGGRAVGCSNRHYGEPRNLLRPGRGTRMDDGWETARNPARPAVIVSDAATGLVDMPGAQDWCVLRLAAVAGAIRGVEIDTAHFRGNYPESVLVEACYAPSASSSALLTDGVEWETLLPRTRLGPDAIHSFGPEALSSERAARRVSHLRVTILPDGGIMRVRAVGEAVEPMPPEGSGQRGGGGGGGSGGGEIGGGAGGSGGSGGGGSSLRLRGGGGTSSGGEAASADAAAVDAALGWSARQSHILTGGGAAEELYCASRGFPYTDDELPHHHLVGGTSRSVFKSWAAEADADVTASTAQQQQLPSWLPGVWARSLFSGGGLSSTDADETCVNLVTAQGPFVDIRIPTARDALLGEPTNAKWDAVAAAVAAGEPRPLASLSDLEVSTCAEAARTPPRTSRPASSQLSSRATARA